MIEPFVPIYHRNPNRFVEYVVRPFNDGAGHTGKTRVARYIDKNGKHQEVVAQILWDREPFSRSLR
jgi:hypothetical protein